LSPKRKTIIPDSSSSAVYAIDIGFDGHAFCTADLQILAVLERILRTYLKQMALCNPEPSATKLVD
jgi:hypothetical protein